MPGGIECFWWGELFLGAAIFRALLMPRPGAVYFLVKILLRTLLKPIEKRIGPLCARGPPQMAESSIVKLLEARRNRVRRTPDVARPRLKGLRCMSG
jgi:hypothetical protein